MPLGEFIAEIGLKTIFECIIYGISYWTGFIILKLLSLGKLNLAPLSTIETKNRGKTKPWQTDWSIWLKHSNRKKTALKAEVTCLIGMLCLATGGVLVYLAVR